MFITPSFKKSLIAEQFQGNYLKRKRNSYVFHPPCESLVEQRRHLPSDWRQKRDPIFAHIVTSICWPQLLRPDPQHPELQLHLEAQKSF